MVKRGLIVNYYFPPIGGGGVQRWSKFIKYLSRQNWHFNVITHQPSPDEINDSTLLKDIPNSTIATQISDTFSKKKNKINSNYIKRWLASFIYVTDSRKYWVKKAWKRVSEELSGSNYDVVICSIPPYSVSELVLNIKNNFSEIPVVLDMRDPWSINPYKIYPTPIHKYFDRRNELKTIRELDYIISAYHSSLNYYKNKIDEFDKKHNIVIPNGYDEEDFEKLNFIKLPNPEIFNIAFSGTFYSHINRPDSLFKALALLKKEGHKINFHHIGSSVYDVKKLATKYGVDDICVNWGYKNHNECLEILNSMDAFVVILDLKNKNAGNTIGGKVYEYLRLKRPILGLVPEKGEAAQLISGTQSGTVCASSIIENIAEAIKKVKSSKYKNIEIEQYMRKNLAKKLNDYLIKIIKK